MEQELETLLHHLGQDIGYMGLRLQKDVQKCLKDYRTTHDHKKYCSKLTDILQTFSEFTTRYSKDLQGRIKEYNKEEEYSDITKKLQEISLTKNSCHTCKNQEKNSQTSNSLGPPSSNNNNDESSGSSKYELKNEVLSQYSLHIGNEDDIKFEQVTQAQSTAVQNNSSANDHTDPQEGHLSQQQLNDSLFEATSYSHVDNEISDSQDDDVVEHDTDIANSLEISHSEEIQSSADGNEEVILSISDEGNTTDSEASKSDNSKDGNLESAPGENAPLTVNNVTEFHDYHEPHKIDVIPLPYEQLFTQKDRSVQESAVSTTCPVAEPTCKSDLHGNHSKYLDEVQITSHHTEEPQKVNVIPLPYKPLFEKETSIQETAASTTNSVFEPVSISLSERKLVDYTVAESHDSDKPQKMDVIPLPYEPLFGERNTVEKYAAPKADPRVEPILVEDDGGSNVKDNVCEVKPVSLQKDIELLNIDCNSSSKAKSTYENGDDPDVEIVSIASSHEEIDQGTSELRDGNTTTVLEEDDDSDVEIIESLPSALVDTNTKSASESIDSEAETVKNTSPQAENGLHYSHSSEESLATLPGEPEVAISAKSSDSDAETIRTDFNRSQSVAASLPNIVEKPLETDEWDIETVANTSPHPNSAVLERHSEFDTETVNNSPQKHNVDSYDSDATFTDDFPKSRGKVITTHSDLNTPLAQIEHPSLPNPVIGKDCQDAPLAALLEADDNGSAESEGNYSEGTIANCSPSTGVGTHDSDDTIIASPLSEAKKNDTRETSENIQTLNKTENRDESDNNDDIYWEATQKTSTNAQMSNAVLDEDSDVDFDAPTQDVSDHRASKCKDTFKSKNERSDRDIVDNTSQDDRTIDNNGGLIALRGNKTASSVEESTDVDEDQEEAATQDVEIPETVPDGNVLEEGEDKLSQESYVFNLDNDSIEGSEKNLPESNQVVDNVGPKNDENDSQESFVFDGENDKHNAEVLSLHNTSEGASLTGVRSLASPNNEDETVGENIDDKNLSISEFSESESSSDASDIETTSRQTNKKLKDEDRKSLLKVIADYFSKRKKQKEATEKNIDNSKDDRKKESKKKNSSKKRDKTTPNKSKKTKKAEPDNYVKIKKEKRKNKKGERDAEEYLDVLSASRVDETSSSSADLVKNNVNIQECSSDFSDNGATQIEGFERQKNKKTSERNEENVDAKNKTASESSRHHSGEDLFGPFQKATENRSKTSTAEVAVQSISDFINQLPSKPTKSTSDNIKEANEELNVTQKVDDIRKLRHISMKDIDSVFNEPTRKVSNYSIKSSKENENQGIEDEPLNKEDIDEGQVVSPFKRKVVRPLPSTLSDGEESEFLNSRETEEGSQVVSSFKKKCVKRLHSSDESDSEPPKNISEAKDNQSDEFDSDTQLAKPFKKAVVKRLLSTDDDESEVDHKKPDDDENEHKPKRRKVQGSTCSKHSSLEEMTIDQNTDKDLDGNRNKKTQGISEDDDCYIEPSLFSLDDKARDDFLNLFEQDSNDSGGLVEDSSNKESAEEGIAVRSGNEEDIAAVEADQFKLTDCDRDNLLNMLTDKENDERDEDEKGESSQGGGNSATNKPLNNVNKKDNDADTRGDVLNMPSQFKLNSQARDEFLDLLSNETSNDNDGGQEGSMKKGASYFSNLILPGKDDNVVNNKPNDNTDTPVEQNQFKLNSSDRDELLEMLSSDQDDNNSRVQGDGQDKYAKNIENGTLKESSVEQKENIKNELGNDEEVVSSQFKLNDKARDDLLDMLNSDQSDNSRNNNKKKAATSNNTATDQSRGTQNDDRDTQNYDADSKKHIDNIKSLLENLDDDENSSKLNDDKTRGKGEAMDIGKDGEEDVSDIDDTVTENSQGIDDVDQLDNDCGDNETLKAGDVEEDSNIENENNITKAPEFTLNESERDELINLLSNHIQDKQTDSSSDTSDMDQASNENKKKRLKKKKLKKVDRNVLLELLQEYEDAVTGKVIDKTLVEYNLNGEMDFGNMDDEHAESAICEGSGPHSESVLLDLLREEAVEQPQEGKRKKSRNTSKAAWQAYQQLLKDNDELSDTSSGISDDIDIDDFDLDLSDQERKRKEREVHKKLRMEFNINKELIINVEQADISGLDLSLLPPRKDEKKPSNIDRLCDISTVLQKRKKPEKKKPKAKIPRLSPSVPRSVSGSSDSDNDSIASSLSSHWSDSSLRVNNDSTSNRDSPFPNMSDDNVEQEKLANALWENIKNSSDENSEWSSDSDNKSSDDDIDRKKKSKKSGEKRKKEKEMRKNDSEEEDVPEENTDSEESNNDDESDIESEDEGRNSGDVKTDLDSSDEEDFVGVRKTKGAWKHDPLLQSCFTSDESDSDSDGDQKARSRIRKKLCRKKLLKNVVQISDSDKEKDGPTKEPEHSSDSDVEFIMEKKKTPQKTVEEADEEDSPSKRGMGRRNIRALVEDDELAEATKKAKKEETERIKRLQERERAKETFTQSQSFGSQMSEDESDPLILDVSGDLQVKVHPKITKKLKPHQRIGIQFMWDSCYESVEQLKTGYEGSGCILAHCMGLGKTLQALGLIYTVFSYKEVTKMKHVLVVCPLSTVSNWRNEFRLAYKDIRNCKVQLYTIQDKKPAVQRFEIVEKWRRNGGVLVMGYECFGLLINDQKWDKWANKIPFKKEEMLKALVNPGPDLVICDEGHLLRNKQTQRNLALNRIETKRRIVLTGTPLQNNLLEYYYMVHFVKPNLLGTEKEYKTNFINPIINGQFEDSTAIDILFMKKRTHVLHKILNKTVQRVEDTELKRYLPELIDQALFVRLSDLQVQFYNTYLDGANARPLEYTAAGNISRKHFLADIHILRYICTHPDIVTIARRNIKSKIKERDVIDDNMDDIEDKMFSKGDWFKDLVPESGVKKPELGTKMMVALGIVKEAIANDDKVLIFSQAHAEMDSLEFFLKQELNYKKGVDYNRMDGTINPELRTHMCDTFNNKHNKKLKVFIMSTKVGGLGLNLTAANRVILMNVNWNPSYDTQSVFRAFRFGQNKAVYVYRLIAIDTMEEKMYQRQVTKLAVAHRVVDKHQITRHYSAADIQEFYSVRPTTEGERPLPNVPEDRVLANLIQRHQCLYKWHEHQALLANRPEEDLNEQQKNAAWEEFNRKTVEPPPPGLIPPQFLNASDILNLPGPSGLQPRLMPPGCPPIFPKPRQRIRKSRTLNKTLDPLQAMSTYVPPKTVPVQIRQTPSGPKLVIQSTEFTGRIRSKQIPFYLQVVPPRQHAVHPPFVDRDVSRDNDAARKIREINSLISAQTTPGLISGFNAITTNPLTSSTVRDHEHSSRIDEINSITHAILNQSDVISTEDWADDGMNSSLVNLNLPEDDCEE